MFSSVSDLTHWDEQVPHGTTPPVERQTQIHCRLLSAEPGSCSMVSQTAFPARAQVPQGATPRNLTVHLRGALTRSAKPGDAVTVAGVFLPEPFTGFRAMRAGLLTSVYLQARPPAMACRGQGGASKWLGALHIVQR